MRPILFTLLLCLPIFAMGQIDNSAPHKENEHVLSTLPLEKGAVLQITNDLDRKIDTTLLQDMPYPQFEVAFDAHKTYNLSFGQPSNKKSMVLDTQPSERHLVKLKPMYYFYGQFETSE